MVASARRRFSRRLSFQIPRKDARAEDDVPHGTRKRMEIPIRLLVLMTLLSATAKLLARYGAREGGKADPSPPATWVEEPWSAYDFWTRRSAVEATFWEENEDRVFMRDFYPRLGRFRRVLDVGARGYNRRCKDLINSTSTEYVQMEPNPPSDRSEMRNDGLLEMYMKDVPARRPDLAGSFDVVIDFGVFGWDEIQMLFSGDEDVRMYVDGVRFLLGEGGMWALKTDRDWVAEEDEFIAKWISPHFRQGKFDTYESGHNIGDKESEDGEYKFHWFYKLR
mmetsp:Transcript_35449/g.75686  ORF Transcript_35449/g.75686 Transcript_35449/m.75686 type:complete len:279 (-) Transcript_35449:23-859(-)